MGWFFGFKLYLICNEKGELLNFIANLLGAIAAYCLFPKKPCINVQRTFDTQLTLF